MDAQDVTALAIIMQNKLMVFPERWPMGDSQERDASDAGMFHHLGLHIKRN